MRTLEQVRGHLAAQHKKPPALLPVSSLVDRRKTLHPRSSRPSPAGRDPAGERGRAHGGGEDAAGPLRAGDAGGEGGGGYVVSGGARAGLSAYRSTCIGTWLSLCGQHPDIVATRPGRFRKAPARSVVFVQCVRATEFRLADLARIIAVVEPEVIAFGFDLVRVRIFKTSEIGDADELTLQIMAEDPATGQLILDQCAGLSRRVSDRFDELEAEGEVLIDEAYRLEVSSPGIDRPLTRPQDYTNWIGHEAKFQLANPIEGNRKGLQGDLAAFDSEPGHEIVTLDDKKSGRVSFPLADVQSARLVLTDRLLAAARPLDTSGADEEVFEDGVEALAEQED
jgi:ribosome maturation factor RimP